jgi:transcriptional regulator with XRE-family HTH domain
MPSIASRVRRARRASGLSQTALAAATGVKRSAVAQWEGDGAKPTAEHMRLLAASTGVQFEWLATGRGQQYQGGVPQADGEIFGIANSALESRMLDAMKGLCQSKQELAVKIVDVFVDA